MVHGLIGLWSVLNWISLVCFSLGLFRRTQANIRTCRSWGIEATELERPHWAEAQEWFRSAMWGTAGREWRLKPEMTRKHLTFSQLYGHETSDLSALYDIFIIQSFIRLLGQAHKAFSLSGDLAAHQHSGDTFYGLQMCNSLFVWVCVSELQWEGGAPDQSALNLYPSPTGSCPFFLSRPERKHL